MSALSFSTLNPERRRVLAAVRALSSSRERSATALGVSEAQYFEVERNRVVRRSPVMPAIDRYTGVLYDALDAESLTPAAREFARDHIVIHSAMFGLVRALDLIPAYRLSHDSRLPGLPLRKTWSGAVASELESLRGLVLDARSESYVRLGPAPESSVFLRVVTEGEDGAHRALNHFNKKAKGEFVRELLLAQIEHPTVDSLLAWAASSGIRLDQARTGELQLVV